MMKRALKVTFGAVLAVGTLGTAQANMGQLAEHFGVQVTGTYTKASNNAQSFGDQFIADPLLNGGGKSGDPVFVDNKYKFDWGLGVMYGFSDKTRLFFNYDHFSKSHGSSAVDVRNLGVAFPQNGHTLATGNVSYHTNEYGLGVAHMWEQSPRFSVDYRAQLEWDRYAQEIFETNTGTNVLAKRDTTNTFRGFGPGVGLMAHGKPLSNCPAFGVFAGGMASLLYGRNEFSVVAYDLLGINYQIQPQNSHSVVGKLDVKFGVDYNNHFNLDCGKIPYGIALGMRYMNAMNAFKNGNTRVDAIALNPAVPALRSWTFNQGTPSDFGRFGPYLQLSLGAHS